MPLQVMVVAKRRPTTTRKQKKTKRTARRKVRKSKKRSMRRKRTRVTDSHLLAVKNPELAQIFASKPLREAVAKQTKRYGKLVNILNATKQKLAAYDVVS